MATNIKHFFNALYELHHLVQQKHYEEENSFERLPAILKMVFDVELCSIYRFDYTKNHLSLQFSYGHPQSMLDIVNFQLGKGNVRQIARLHRPFFGNLMATASQAILNKKQVNSLAGIPIIINSFLIGVLVCGSYSPNAFTKKELILLDLLGGFIGQLLIKNQWIDSRIKDQIKL